MTAIDTRSNEQRLFDSLPAQEQWKRLGKIIRTQLSFPVPADDEMLGIPIEMHYGDPLSAAVTIPSTYPLVNSAMGAPLLFKVSTVSYMPAEGSAFMAEYLQDELAKVGLTREIMLARNAARKTNYRGGDMVYHGMDCVGTLAVNLRESRHLQGTLSIDSFAIRGWPEYAPSILPPGVFKEGAHLVLSAANLRLKMKSLTDCLPEDMGAISIYTKDRHGSNWSIHCNGFAK